MCPLLHSPFCRCDHQADLAAVCGCQNDHALSQLLLELVTQVAQSVHIHSVQLSREEFHSGHFPYLVQDIPCGILCHLAL